MHDITIGELKKFLLNSRIAEQFAWEHYEELAERQHTHTLYGPYDPGLGASIPCNTVTPRRARKLLHKTRRKDYIIYQLDENYKVLRTILVLDHDKVNCVYHHFDIDGTVYAYPFRGCSKQRCINDDVHFFRYVDGKPTCYGVSSKNFVFVQFYEYFDHERMMVTTYRYAPNAKRNSNGYLIDVEAPIGAMNSSVQRRVYEEIPENTDFSQWFR